MADSDIRQRKPQAEQQAVKDAKSSSKIDEEEKDSSRWVDVLRVLAFILVGSYVLSLIFTGGSSGFWGLKDKPRYMRLDWWRTQLAGPEYMTPENLARFDGSDPSKPVLLAINGTIYDVSAGRRIYGAGGSYNHFAGIDASRAYVTGCFADDRTPDMRGVEEMFLPVDNPEVDSYWTPQELEEMRVTELEQAKEKAYNALKHWVDFFANNQKYLPVGFVKREEGWLEKQEKRELCAAAQKARPKRKIPKKN